MRGEIPERVTRFYYWVAALAAQDDVYIHVRSARPRTTTQKFTIIIMLIIINDLDIFFHHLTPPNHGCMLTSCDGFTRLVRNDAVC